MSKDLNLINSENEWPLISIGITCFNAVETIERALNSAFSQDWPNFEVLVVNDFSVDGSKEILDHWETKKKRIRIFHNSKNEGCAFSRNIIISNASGEFIAFFDDDDLSKPARLKLQYKRLKDYEEQYSADLVACFASGNRIYENGYIKKFKAVGNSAIVPIGIQMANYLLFNERLPEVKYGAGVPASGMFTRKKIFKLIGGYDTSIRRQEDVEFSIRLSFKGGHFIGIKESVLNQYASKSNDKSSKIEYDSSIYIIEKYSDYLREKDFYYYLKKWMRMKYFHFISNDFKAFLILVQISLKFPKKTIKHFSHSAYNRYLHELLMNSKNVNSDLIYKFIKFVSNIITIK